MLVLGTNIYEQNKQNNKDAKKSEKNGSHELKRSKCTLLNHYKRKLADHPC